MKIQLADRSIYRVSDCKDGRKEISRVAPYDETEYHWAVSNQDGNRWTVYRHSPGRAVCTIGTDSPEEVAQVCKVNDDKLGLKRAGGIW